MQPASSSLDAQWPDLVAAVSAAIDLEATARASGALVRRRAIRSAEMLLRLALAYGPGGPAPRGDELVGLRGRPARPRQPHGVFPRRGDRGVARGAPGRPWRAAAPLRV